MKSKVLSLSVACIAFAGISTASMAEVNIIGRLQCSEIAQQFRTGAKNESGFEARVAISGVREGKGQSSTSGPWRIDARQTVSESWIVTISSSYAIDLVGEGHRGNLDSWKYVLKGQVSNGNATNGQLTGSLISAAGRADAYRTCSYTFDVQGGTLADATKTLAEAKLAQQQKDMGSEKASIAADKEKVAERARKVEADKLAVAEAARKLEEGKKELAEQQARIAEEKKQAAERERLAALEAKRAAAAARQKKAEQERKETDGKREAEHVQLAANQQAIQAKQAATDKRVGNVEIVLGNIILALGERASEWNPRAQLIPVQQQQFCRVIDKFHDDLAAVYKTRNEIKKNSLYKDRQQDVVALLPNGAIENWLVRLVEVTQSKDGSAAVMLQLPCRAMLGSDSCAKDSSKPQATIATNSAAFRELQRMDTGNFVVVSGRILFAANDAAPKALPSYATYQPGTHCTGTEGGKQQDVFTTDIRYLVQLR